MKERRTPWSQISLEFTNEQHPSAVWETHLDMGGLKAVLVFNATHSASVFEPNFKSIEKQQN